MTIEERNEIIEQCAAVVDQCTREGMYQINGAAVRIRAMKNDPMPTDGPGIIEIKFVDGDDSKVQ